VPLFRLLLLLLSLLLSALPAAGYSVPTHQAIVDSTWDRHLLPLLRARYPVQLSPTDSAAAPAPLQNSNLDTGQPLAAGTYALADAAHGRLLRKLHQQHFEHLSAPLCRDLLRFFAAGLPPVIDEKKKRKQKKQAREQQETKLALAALRALSPASAMPGK